MAFNDKTKLDEFPQYNDVLFLELNSTARKDALRQMADINVGEGLYDLSTAEEFSKMIVDGYNPDRDFRFMQYPGSNPDEVNVHFKG